MTRAVLVLLLCTLAGCGLFESVPEVPEPPDPGQAAHDLRVASERGCNVYDACRKAGVCPRNERAEMSCAAVRGVCSEPVSE